MNRMLWFKKRKTYDITLVLWQFTKGMNLIQSTRSAQPHASVLGSLYNLALACPSIPKTSTLPPYIPTCLRVFNTLLYSPESVSQPSFITLYKHQPSRWRLPTLPSPSRVLLLSSQPKSQLALPSVSLTLLHPPPLAEPLIRSANVDLITKGRPKPLLLLVFLLPVVTRLFVSSSHGYIMTDFDWQNIRGPYCHSSYLQGRPRFRT